MFPTSLFQIRSTQDRHSPPPVTSMHLQGLCPQVCPPQPELSNADQEAPPCSEPRLAQLLPIPSLRGRHLACHLALLAAILWSWGGSVRLVTLSPDHKMGSGLAWHPKSLQWFLGLLLRRLSSRPLWVLMWNMAARHPGRLGNHRLLAPTQRRTGPSGRTVKVWLPPHPFLCHHLPPPTTRTWTLREDMPLSSTRCHGLG